MQINQFGPDKNRTTAPIMQGDAWQDSAFFAPGMETDSEHKLAWPIGQTLAGVFHGIREKKNVGPKSCAHYGVFETSTGTKFRCDAPGQLRYNLQNLTVGTYIEITYLGKEEVEDKGLCHKFELTGEVAQ